MWLIYQNESERETLSAYVLYITHDDVGAHKQLSCTKREEQHGVGCLQDSDLRVCLYVCMCVHLPVSI